MTSMQLGFGWWRSLEIFGFSSQRSKLGPPAQQASILTTRPQFMICKMFYSLTFKGPRVWVAVGRMICHFGRVSVYKMCTAALTFSHDFSIKNTAQSWWSEQLCTYKQLFLSYMLIGPAVANIPDSIIWIGSLLKGLAALLTKNK